MRGAYYVTIALLVVASSQISAEFGHQLQAYDHDVTAADDAVAETLAKRSLRGSRDVSNDVAIEERTKYSNVIEDGIEMLLRAAEALKEMPRAAVAVKDMPRAEEAVEKMAPIAEQDLLKNVIGADEASKRRRAPHGISTQRTLALPFKEWNTELKQMRGGSVLKKYRSKIKSVHQAFVDLCDKDLNPTVTETALLWGMFDWDVKSYSASAHKHNLIRLAKRYVHKDVVQIQSDDLAWNRWNEVSIPLRIGALNILLNLHYQRWVRMYNIFEQYQSALIGTPVSLELSLGGTTGTSSATALDKHLEVPMNKASTSKGKSSVFTRSSKRAFDSKTGTTSPSSKHSKMQRSSSPLTESTTSGDDPVFTKRSRHGVAVTSLSSISN
uniref:Secreted RxLR effector protein 118 n=1 Tax=Plasmopara viticola TaxID=143451 RepID=RL118_PLAVT|nr:RecName: Full=Secreted RxLR effector protein 118; Flags: Precursor [Plasmopara viticola]